MTNGNTNFAFLMDLLDIKAVMLCEAIGADKTLVSRWRSGKRRLMVNHHWVDKVALFFIEVDNKRTHPILDEVLSVYYPGENTEDIQEKKVLLTHWLTTKGQQEATYHSQRLSFFDGIKSKINELSKSEVDDIDEAEAITSTPKLENAVVYGVKGVQGSALQFLETASAQPMPTEMMFACPEGLDMLTRDERFLPHFFDALMNLFKTGYTMSVVLRTDYRVSDIAVFSGPWLVAHLLGYIKSYYYDDFVSSSPDKMLAVVPGKLAGLVSESEDGNLYTAIRFDKEGIEDTFNKIKYYQSKSKTRFHYHFFENPDDFLLNVTPLADKPHYQFARLPHFCLVDEETFQEGFSLTGEEFAHIKKEFPCLLTTPKIFDDTTVIRHIFCEDDIEEALLKNRHVSKELTSIMGRRAIMRTQDLVDRLVLIKAYITQNHNYEVCFLPDAAFNKMTMQIACWGDKAAIGWIAGGKSTACKDYTNANALTGFCENVWNTVPMVAKGRFVAQRKLNTWLKKAHKYGYKID